MGTEVRLPEYYKILRMQVVGARRRPRYRMCPMCVPGPHIYEIVAFCALFCGSGPFVAYCCGPSKDGFNHERTRPSCNPKYGVSCTEKERSGYSRSQNVGI